MPRPRRNEISSALARCGGAFSNFRRSAPPLTASRSISIRGLSKTSSSEKPRSGFSTTITSFGASPGRSPRDLPRGFVKRLPQLASGPNRGLPRVDVLARDFIAKSGVVVDRMTLSRFVDAYQTVAPLTIAELWALPTMLRASVLGSLLFFLDELHVPVDGAADRVRFPRPRIEGAPALAPAAGVERAIRALRLLAEIDWKAFFESSNRVEAALRRDPADVYARMDFDTCDSYRKAVEDLAWETGVPEEDVASLAVRLAQNAAPDSRRGHVGFYLVGGGRPTLEAQVGYRPKGIARVRRLVTRFATLTYFLPLVILTGGSLLFGWRQLMKASAGAGAPSGWGQSSWFSSRSSWRWRPCRSGRWPR